MQTCFSSTATTYRTAPRYRRFKKGSPAPGLLWVKRRLRAQLRRSIAFVRSPLKPGHEVKRAAHVRKMPNPTRSEGRCCAIAADAPGTTLERSVGLLDRKRVAQGTREQ